MKRSTKAVKKTTSASAAKAKPLRPISLDDVPELTPEQLARATRRDPNRPRRAMPLESIRKGSGLTQVDVAKASGMTQGEVSRLETRASLEGVRLETLRRYVEGLGGTLEVVAAFPTGHRIALAGAPRKTD